jgi:3-methylcrotonyl-CoA carboxylase alpha subunit/acetyl-CoA/propionyl-CoA carboxylase biotin carboxyl carrier protein
VDAALEQGAEVSTAYDPMLGKVVAAGPTRESARQSLVTALDDTAILGLTTNLGFLRGLVASDSFRDAEIDTAWLDRHPDAVRPPDPEMAVVLAAWALAQGLPGQQEAPDPGPFAVRDGWRLGGPPAPVAVELRVAEETRVLPVGAAAVDSHQVRRVAAEPGVLRLEVDGLVEEGSVLVLPHEVQVSHRGHAFVFGRPDPFGATDRLAVGDGSVAAPMPGTVLAVHVAAGAPVTAGQVLGVLEAMKMELSLAAPFDGVVTEVSTAPGAQVALGAVLFRVETGEAP